MHLADMPIMSRKLSELPELSFPKGVDIVRVRNQQDQAGWLMVMMEGFEEPEPARPDVQMYLANSISEAIPVFEHFLAYWDGIPCAISSFVRASLGAGIYNVATLPAYRGRGLGRAMTLTVMQSAQNAGYSTSMLSATTSGFPVYKRLGFETISTGDLYIWNGNG